MNHSTPVRQRILNKSTTNGMSPIRRSLAATSTPFPAHTNDDESERNRRRSRAEVARNVSKASSSFVEEITSENVQDHFKTCLQLFADNKINIKNVWSLRIIDYMRTALEANEGDLGDALKLASASLDVSSKIYGLRVDDVHNEVMKLADFMARVRVAKEKSNQANGDAGGDDGIEDEDAADEENAGKQTSKQNKKRKTTANAYVVAEESLNGQFLRNDGTYACNLGRRGTTDASINLLLPTMPGTYSSLVPCRASVLALWQAEEREKEPKLIQYRIPPPKPDKFNVICPSFADFAADDCSDQHLDDLSRLSSHSVCNELVYDEDGLAIPEVEAMPANDIHTDYESGGEEEPANTETVHVTDMRPQPDTFSNLEYSFRPTVPITSERYGITGAWAGPAHWKIKLLRKPRSSTVSTERQSAARASRVIVPVDINMKRPPSPPIAEYIRDTTRRFKPCLDNFNRTLLPEDAGIGKLELESLLVKPSKVVQRLLRVSSQKSSSQEHASQPFNTSVVYEYNNEEDVQYCRRIPSEGPGWVDADNCPDDDVHHDADDFCGDGDNEFARTITDNDVRSAPNLVPQSTVPYATRAKKIDMKSLKMAMWADVEKGYNKREGIMFTELYERLPAALPPRAAEELSIPLAFVSLLHLANENTLDIRGTSDLSDASIHKG